MKRFVIIPAAGIGQRFGSSTPKQFTLLDHKPILMRTMERFSFLNEKIILVLHPDSILFWKDICDKYAFHIPHVVVEGGNSRTDSVKNALATIKDDGIVAIHDAVRPLVCRELIEKALKAAEKYGNAVPVIEIPHSLRKTEGEKNSAVNRKDYKIVQTPQCFQISKLKAAYATFPNREFTDDASVYEAYGEKIHLIDGDSSNIKITEPFDLAVAESILRTK